jgi:hypothetical protein
MADDEPVQSFEHTEEEVEAIATLLKGGLEASDAWGRHVFKSNFVDSPPYMMQDHCRGCSEYDTAEDAARAFLFGCMRWDR